MRIIILTLFLIASLTSHAEIVSGDKTYTLFEDGGYQYILTDEHRYILPELVHFNHFFLKEYQRSFNWKFDEKASLIIASMQNQITNGYATPAPNLMTVFYPTGGNSDSFASLSWVHMLLAHETTHLYQLNTKQGFAKDLHPVIGNPIFFLTPWFVPVFVNPNLINPTFLLEGNAVFNESRFGLGGRLFSGEYRAVVYALAKGGKINMKRLFNDHLYFPFGLEKYMVGGYFFNYVRDALTTDQTNHIFLNHGKHYINPLILDNSFEEVYGSSYEAWIEAFIKDISAKASTQKSSNAESLMFGLSWGGFNHDQETVFGLMQENQKSPPWFIRINKQTGKIVEKKRMDIPEGKVFWMDGRWWAVSSKTVSPTLIEFGLYKEGWWPSQQFRSQVVQDLRGGHTLTVDTTTSLRDNQLLLDGKRLASANSSAILDDAGHAYYFKQQRKTRTLYKDDKPIFSFQGYYAKLIEADVNGKIYFISTTDAGSSLYAFYDGKIHRLSDSDTIVDARLLSAKSAAAIEVSDKGYDLKIIPLEQTQKNPQEYVYGFEKEPTAQTYFDLQKETFPNPSLKEKEYSPLKQLRKSTFEPNIGFFQDEITGGFRATFVDPLLLNSLAFSYARLAHFNDEALVIYNNARHRLNWYLGSFYFEESAHFEENLIGRTYNNMAFIGLSYPFFKRGHWSIDGIVETSYVNDDKIFSRRPKNSMESLAALTIQHTKQYPLSFDPYRQYSLTLSYGSNNDADKGLKKHHDAFGAKASVVYDVYKENILSAHACSSFATKDSLFINEPGTLKTQPYNFTSLLPGFSATAREIKSTGLTYKKVFHTPVYFVKIPVGLRRMAPFASLNYFKLKQTDDNEFDRDFTQWEAGLDVEFLVAHRFPFRFAFSWTKDNRNLTPEGLYLRTSGQWQF